MAIFIYERGLKGKGLGRKFLKGGGLSQKRGLTHDTLKGVPVEKGGLFLNLLRSILNIKVVIRKL